MLPLLAPQEYFCPSHTSSKPHKSSRAARIPSIPTTPHQPGHLESLPAFVLPAASSPDEESSSSDSSDCRSSTMERSGPGESGKEGRRDRKEGFRALPGSLQGPLHFQGHMSFLTPQSPKCTHTNPHRSPSDHVGPATHLQGLSPRLPST